MSKMRAGNQGREGEQSMARNWSLKQRWPGEKCQWDTQQTFFFLQENILIFNFSFVVLQHKHLSCSENL